ncbi:hypothetical protein CH54_2866 [Yersinia rochesterensis]|uniref:Uncharacterized protein n=1 Tax=Yersinia rochesterensis TaxID=1604335 RepID=A0A386HIV4_9GAMM|nr:hypothetical protein DJ57_3683 [Yersinia rochesterensis]AJI85318.1 hypothetical protein AW19_2923 [Yersinia frederiksenii Y225]CNH84020.1 Uncharacterised protein [Yersinia kristensenii]AJJ34262.1 hypothetical protein CH54_2866 [Yersinia rochesterensis]AYD45546.1 hypothetical protein DXZ79_18770 [Yersinia rochesterensis]
MMQQKNRINRPFAHKTATFQKPDVLLTKVSLISAQNFSYSNQLYSGKSPQKTDNVSLLNNLIVHTAKINLVLCPKMGKSFY